MNQPSMRQDVTVDAGGHRPSRSMLVGSLGRPVVIRRRERVLARGGNSFTGS